MKLPRVAHWELAVAVQCAALGLWLVHPAFAWAAAALSLAILSVALAIRLRRLTPVAMALIGLTASLSAVHTSWRVRAVETDWAEFKENLILSASERLDETLSSAVELARSLAASAADAAGVPPNEAFTLLANAVAHDGPERGAVVFDGAGRALAWAGRHRLSPDTGSAELSARITEFYVLLEARRQAGSYLGVGQVVLAADSAVPDRDDTVAERFTRQTGATLEFYPPRSAPDTGAVFDYTLEADTLFSVRTVPPAQGTFKLELLATGGRRATLLVLATLVLLVLHAGAVARWLGLVGAAMLFVLTPAGSRLELGELFSFAPYFLEVLGPISASAGSLLISAALSVVVLVPLARRGLTRRTTGIVAAALLVLVAPYAVAFLAGGITPPTSGIGLGLWLTWETALAVAGAVVLLTTALLVRGRGESLAPRWTAWAAGLWAAGSAVLDLLIWHPVTGWPAWYAFVWLPAILLTVLPAPRVRMVATAAVVSGAAAALLTWGAVVQGRLLLAERDANRVREGDPLPIGMLDRFSDSLVAGEVPRTAASLYAAWRRSPLSQDDYPAVLATWGPDGQELARLELAQLDLNPALLRALAASARDTMVPLIDKVVQPPGVHYVAQIPFSDGSVVTVGVGPRSRLIEPVRVARFLRGERRLNAPYEMSLGDPLAEFGATDRMTWERTGRTVRGVQILAPPGGVRYRLHVRVPLGGIEQPLVRGSLILFWNALLVGLLWLVGEALTGSLTMSAGLRELVRLRSYRSRLTIVLAGFFILPTLVYAAWGVGRLGADAAKSRHLLIQQTLSDAVGTAREFGDVPADDLRQRLAGLAGGLNADLLWYDGGVLQQASPAVLAELGLIDRFMQPAVYREIVLGDELEATVDAVIGGQATRVGYRRLASPQISGAILAAPRLVDVRDIRSGEEALLFGLLLATLVGLAAAAMLAAVAAQSLAKPVRSLRAAAVAVGRGDRLPPFDPGVPAEFVSVVEAFERMARDVEASQSALETARRRTAAVLKNVATGVVALDRELRVTIANPRAQELLGAPLPAGAHVYALGGTHWSPVWRWVRGFLSGEAEADTREFTIAAGQIRAQVARIHGMPGGCVLALDDTTELTRAVRVLAWGELAQQVAHEIKNPLTPIRLGIQHLKRAHRDPRGDFGAVLDRTAKQILAEIERLDAIARAFARFGAPPAEAAPLARVDLVAVARDTAELYALADGTSVRVEAEADVGAWVRKDEVKEVLVNLVENARNAGATSVEIDVGQDQAGRATICVTDNGQGIPPEDLPRIFEPQFSTTTSGSGLGLAICKRLVESWGGTISVESEVGQGTAVRIATERHGWGGRVESS